MVDEADWIITETMPEEVSMVARGANDQEFLLMKSEDEPTLQEILEKRFDDGSVDILAEILGMESNELSDALESVEGIMKLKFSGAVRALADRTDNNAEDVARAVMGTEEDMERSFNTDEESQDMSEETEDVEKETTSEGGSEMAEEKEGQEPDEKVEKEEDGSEDVEKESPSDEESGLPEDIQKKLDRLEELEKEQEKTQEELHKERDLRIEKEYIQKAQTEYSNVGKDPEELGPMLKELDEGLEEETAESFKSLIKAQAEAIEKGDLFAEFGTSQEGSTHGEEGELEKKAKEVMSERDDIDSIEKARVTVLKEDPELRERIRSG